MSAGLRNAALAQGHPTLAWTPQRSVLAVAQAIAGEITRDVDYRPVKQDGARLPAQRIAELLN